MRGVSPGGLRWAVWLPAVALVGWMLLESSLTPASMIDLQQAFLPAARAVLHGHSPYAGAYARFDLIRSAYVYPPPVAVLAIPFAGLSAAVAGVLFTVPSRYCALSVTTSR